MWRDSEKQGPDSGPCQLWASRRAKERDFVCVICLRERERGTKIMEPNAEQSEMDEWAVCTLMEFSLSEALSFARSSFYGLNNYNSHLSFLTKLSSPFSKISYDSEGCVAQVIKIIYLYCEFLGWFLSLISLYKKKKEKDFISFSFLWDIMDYGYRCPYAWCMGHIILWLEHVKMSKLPLLSWLMCFTLWFMVDFTPIITKKRVLLCFHFQSFCQYQLPKENFNPAGDHMFVDYTTKNHNNH